jgi:hypothetical protein
MPAGADGGPISVTWELQRDMFRYQTDVEGARAASEFPDAIVNATEKGAELKMPETGGGYRLYAYVHTARNGSATANACLYVEGSPPRPTTPKAELPLVIFGPEPE